jgi:glycerol uptake facilitator protein
VPAPAPAPARPLLDAALQRKLAFEVAGTGLLVLIGCGCVSSAKYLGSGLGLGGAAVVWGSGVALAVYATREASGAHLNPAVTAALAVHRPDAVAPGVAALYVAAQVAGAAAASALNYAVFSGPIRAFEAREKIVRGAPGSAASYAGAFGIVPSALRAPGTLAAEVLATGALLFVIFALGDARNNVPAGAAPALVGATVTSLIAVFGPVTGAGMNPARDLGPRLVTLAAGWGGASLSGAAVYTAGPVIGAILGGGLYDALSRMPVE